MLLGLEGLGIQLYWLIHMRDRLMDMLLGVAEKEVPQLKRDPNHAWLRDALYKELKYFVLR